ncbi:hypothetical protein HRbin19_01107 [bacterium HR19]|nr:hypothetical protein HRbin19_01107 [bacterium HR19]
MSFINLFRGFARLFLTESKIVCSPKNCLVSTFTGKPNISGTIVTALTNF